MSAHTPGPWRITYRYGVLTDQVGIDGRTVCTVWVRQQGHRPSVVDTEPWPEGDANAHLIAAAPELLDALRAAVDLYGKPGGPWNVPGSAGCWITQARAAIAAATATGETT